MNVVVGIHQLNCLLTWAVLTAAKNAFGRFLGGDVQMKIDVMIQSAYVQFESPNIIPREMMLKIAEDYIIQGGIILAIVVWGIVMKSAGAGR
jgi:hypothetical protein